MKLAFTSGVGAMMRILFVFTKAQFAKCWDYWADSGWLTRSGSSRKRSSPRHGHDLQTAKRESSCT